MTPIASSQRSVRGWPDFKPSMTAEYRPAGMIVHVSIPPTSASASHAYPATWQAARSWWCLQGQRSCADCGALWSSSPLCRWEVRHAAKGRVSACVRLSNQILLPGSTLSSTGTLDRIQFLPLRNDHAFRVAIENFQVTRASCAKAEDKARLLSAIESAFGTYTPFEVLVRSLLQKSLDENGGVSAEP